MAKYVIDEEILQRLADAIREVNSTTRSYTPAEMIEAVSTVLENGAYILVDENGNEVPAVFVDNEPVFTATANDIRIGTVAVTDEGIIEGTKEIPAYHTSEGYRFVTNGSKFALPMVKDLHEYTKLQAIICPFDKSLNNSVAAEKVAIEDNVYSVQSTVSEAEITVSNEPDIIDFGMTNTSGKPYIIRYFTYKEIY